MLPRFHGYPHSLFRPAVAGVAFTLFLTVAPAAQAQFVARPNDSGDVVILDQSGVEVTVVNGDPVGTRPDVCPDGAYHVSEVPDDISILVLTDCATGEGQFTVETTGQ